jgi:TorA maturation chaperone TorD
MTELSERELGRVRTRLYDLGKSFFAAAPDAEILGRWRGIVTALERESISPAMDEAVENLSRLLGEMNLQQIRDEFYELFINPYSEHSVNLTGSAQLNGKPYGETLVAYREFLKEAEIGKRADIPESEDSLVLMLDAMITLVEQDNAPMQEKLLNEFLLPACSSLTAHLHNNPAARFYTTCAEFLQAYLELEKSL